MKTMDQVNIYRINIKLNFLHRLLIGRFSLVLTKEVIVQNLEIKMILKMKLRMRNIGRFLILMLMINLIGQIVLERR